MHACFVETSSWGHCKNYLKVRWHRSHEGSRTLTISLHTMHKLSISEVSKSSTSAAISSRNNGLLEVLLSDGGSLPLSRVTLSLPTPSELMSSAELELHSCTGLWWWPSGSWAGPGIHAGPERGAWPHSWPRECKLMLRKFQRVYWLLAVYTVRGEMSTLRKTFPDCICRYVRCSPVPRPFRILLPNAFSVRLIPGTQLNVMTS